MFQKFEFGRSKFDFIYFQNTLIKMFEIVRKYFSIIIAVDGSFTSIYIIGREARVISMRNERANDLRNGL